MKLNVKNPAAKLALALSTSAIVLFATGCATTQTPSDSHSEPIQVSSESGTTGVGTDNGTTIGTGGSKTEPGTSKTDKTEPGTSKTGTSEKSTDPSDQLPENTQISRTLAAPGVKTPVQLYRFFMENNPSADRNQVLRLAAYYVGEARAEGINSDCAWVQMCLETGYLKFGGLVVPEMHNYCGLGAMDAAHPGEWFATEQLGVRAHIQHLHAYATTAEVHLKKECIDRRYKYVNPRGKAPTIQGLTKTWAMDPNYGNKLEELLCRLEQF